MLVLIKNNCGDVKPLALRPFVYIFVRGKRITIINAVHFLNVGLDAFSVRNGTVPRVSVFPGWYQSNSLGKSLVKCHMSASQVLKAPTY